MGFYSYSKNNHIAGFLSLLQILLTTWNLRSVLCRFSLLKPYLDLEFLFFPKMCKIFSVRHMNCPQHRFTKHYTCQVCNRIIECDCVWRIPWWMIGVSEFLVKIHFSYKHQENWVQPQLCLIWNLIFSKSTSLTPMILYLKFYLEKACYFDIWKYCSGLLVSEILPLLSQIST